jgi:predicted nucleic acid-binding protein
MKILVDTNVILDYLLERVPFLQDAEALFQGIASGQIAGYATATTLTDVFYVAKRHTQSLERARQAIVIILAVMEICPVNRSVLELALTSEAVDFEDAVQVACALSEGLDAIVTRDAGFFASSIPVLSIHQVLQRLERFK